MFQEVVATNRRPKCEKKLRLTDVWRSNSSWRVMGPRRLGAACTTLAKATSTRGMSQTTSVRLSVLSIAYSCEVLRSRTERLNLPKSSCRDVSASARERVVAPSFSRDKTLLDGQLHWSDLGYRRSTVKAAPKLVWRRFRTSRDGGAFLAFNGSISRRFGGG